jgi:ribosomal RNA-processing protein 12
MNGQSAYDALLNSSDSDLSDNDNEPPKSTKSKKAPRKQETFIRKGWENPINLLEQGSFSNISTQKPITTHEEFQRRAKAASCASTFKSQNHRLVFEEPVPVSKNTSMQTADVPDINAFNKMQKSSDMERRGLRDKVKFSNKRSRVDAEGFEDVEMTEAHCVMKHFFARTFLKC